MTVDWGPPTRAALPNGARLLTVAAARQVAAATVAVPLAGLPIATARYAPAVAGWWAHLVRIAARGAGAVVRVAPVTTADSAGLTVESRTPAELAGVAGWFVGAARAAPAPTALPRMPEPPRSRDERWARRVRRVLFGTAHRYGLGVADRVDSASSADAAAFAAAAARLATVPPVLALHGTAAETGAAAADLADVGYRPASPAAPLPPTRPVVALQTDGYVVQGFAGVPLSSSAKYAHHVAWALLGGREGLLDRALRADVGLTYSLAAFSREFAEAGYAVVYAACAPEATDEVVARIRRTFAALGRGGVPPDLLRDAVERLAIAHHGATRTARGLTERLCLYELAGCAPDTLRAYESRVAEVTPCDISEIARDYLTGE